MPKLNRDDIVEILDVSDEDETEPVSQPETEVSDYQPESKRGRPKKTSAEAEASKERRRIGQLKAKMTREKNKKIREDRERLALRQIIGRTVLDEPEDEYDEDEEYQPYDEIPTYQVPETGHVFNHKVGKPPGRQTFKERTKNTLQYYKPVLAGITNRDLKASRMELELKALMSHNKRLEKKLKAVEKKQPQTIVQVAQPAPQPVQQPVSEVKKTLGEGLVDFFSR